MINFDQVNLSSAQDWLNHWGLTRINGVAVARPGDFVDKNGNKVSITVEQLSALSRRDIPPGERPGVHVGHPVTTFTGEQPRLGSVESLYFDGAFLRADYINVPVWRARDFVETGAYPNRSLELYRKGDGWQVTAVAQLGSSWPAIEGMPTITQEMVDWMEPAEHEETMVEMSSDRDPNQIFWLAGKEPAARETTEMELTKADLDAALSGVKTQLDGMQSALQAKDEKLAAQEKQLELLSSQLNANTGATHAMALSHAQGEAINLSNGLLNQRRITPAMADPEKGNLSGIILHAKLSCPPIKNADGTETPFYQAICNLLSMQPGITPVSTSFASATPAPAYQLPGSQEEQIEQHADAELSAYMKAHPGISMNEALQQMASGRS